MTTMMITDLKVLILIIVSLLPFFLSQGEILPMERSKMFEEPISNSIRDGKLALEGKCNNSKLATKIAKYQPVVNKIFYTILQGAWRNYTWSSLSEFVDRFGPRPSGSNTLEEAIDYMVGTLNFHGLENVHNEPAMVRAWKRGREFCKLMQPREHEMKILGLGGSVSTPPGGITAPAIVVASFEELKARKKEVPGKIVVFNEKWVSYGETVKYRDYAADEAAALGGVASLVRSVTPFSLNTPHTGWQDYKTNVTKIPTACVTVEDAALLHRMALRGEKLVIHLTMEELDLGMARSRNTIGEIKGHTKPKDVVLVSGHLDSWDVGEGAMDDGGGAFVSWNALAVLKMLGLRAKRTLRTVLWTGEEQGLYGGQAYYNQHKNEIKDFNLVMESDSGTFNPRGLVFQGKPQAACVVKEVLKLMKPLNTTEFNYSQEPGPDITFFTRVGVPGMSIMNDNQRYFWFHHTNADTMLVENTKDLDRCLALWAATAYVIADLDEDLPR